MSRPKKPIPSTTVCAWLPADEHDRLIALSIQRETSVSGVVRLAIVSLLENPSPSEPPR